MDKQQSLQEENERLKAKLATAKQALEHYADTATWANQWIGKKGRFVTNKYSPCDDRDYPNGYDLAEKVLKDIENAK